MMWSFDFCAVPLRFSEFFKCKHFKVIFVLLVCNFLEFIKCAASKTKFFYDMTSNVIHQNDVISSLCLNQIVLDINNFRIALFSCLKLPKIKKYLSQTS